MEGDGGELGDGRRFKKRYREKGITQTTQNKIDKAMNFILTA